MLLPKFKYFQCEIDTVSTLQILLSDDIHPATQVSWLGSPAGVDSLSYILYISSGGFPSI